MLVDYVYSDKGLIAQVIEYCSENATGGVGRGVSDYPNI